MKKLLLLSMLLFLFTIAFADTYTIGTGTSSTSYSPFYGFYDYGWNKIIWTAAEINTAGLTGPSDIYGFGFQAYNTPANYIMLDQKVYIRHTTESAYALTSEPYPETTGFTQVFDADVVYNGTGWYYIMFSAPFAWNGTDNLEVLWENWDGDWVSGYPTHSYTSTSTNYRTVYKYQDNTFPGTGTTGIRTYNRPNLRIVTQTLDAAPTAVLAAPSDGAWAFNDVTLVWNNSQGMASSYDVYLGTTTPPAYLTNIADMIYSPTVSAGTTYYWQIVARNANGAGTPSEIRSFKTAGADQLAESFELANPWPPLGWGNPSGFTRSTTTPYHLTAGAYKSTAAAAMLHTPMLELTTTSELNFWARSGATTGIGRIQIKYSADGITWTTVGPEMAMPTNSTWNNYLVDLSTLAGNNYMLGFEVYSSTTTSTTFYIDYVFGPDFAAIVPDPALLIYPADNGWAFLDGSLQWSGSPSGGIPTSYDVYFGTSETPPFVQNQPETTYTPTLAAGTTYFWKIVPRNAAGPADNCPVWSFKTPTATQLAESFEDTNFPPLGWISPDGRFTRSTGTPFHGVASAYEYTNNTVSYLYTPLLGLTSTSELDWWMRTSSTNGVGRVQIVYSSDGVTWIDIGSEISLPTETTWMNYNVDLSSLADNNYFIGFKAYSSSTTYFYVYIDHVVGPEFAAIAPAPVTLVSPADAATQISTTPTLTWTDDYTGGIPTGYKIYLDTNTDPVTLLDTVTGLSYTLTTELDGSRTYYWKVIATNSYGDSSPNAVWSFTTAASPLTGIKTIGAGGDYADFIEAITALNASGIGTGGVTFNVAAGSTFTGNCPPITTTGTSDSPIVFQKSGTGDNPIIYAGVGTSTTTDAILTISGADYITWDGIDLYENAANTDNTTKAERGLAVVAASTTDGAQYNVFKNFKIVLDNTYTSTRGIYHYYASTPVDYSGTNSNNDYYNITVEKAYYGIYMYGTSSTTYLEDNNKIRNCTIGGPNPGDIGGGSSTTYGMYVYYQKDIAINDNVVRNISSASTIYGMYLYFLKGVDSKIYNNKVHSLAYTGTGSSPNYGIYVYLHTTSANAVKVYNNMVWGQTHTYSTASTSYVIHGIYMSSAGSSNTYNVDFNSVRIEGPANASSSALYFSSISGINNIRNNVLTNYSGGHATPYHICLYVANATAVGAAGSVSNNNLFHVANSDGGYVVRGSTTNYATLGDWQTASAQDANSFIGDPQFVSATDLHISTTIPTRVESNASFFEGAIDWVGTDIDGDTRHASTPDIGADEGDFTPMAAEPDHVTLVSPEHEATGLNPINLMLSWNPALTGGVPEFYEVLVGEFPIDPATGYFGDFIFESTTTSLNLTEQQDTAFQIGYDATWYWAVLPYAGTPPESPDPLDAEFMVWKFSTMSDPTISTFPHMESFDGTTFAPFGWMNFKTAGTGNPGIWDRQTAGTLPTCSPHSGAAMARYNSYNLSSGTMGELVTPPLEIPAGAPFKVNFWMYRDSGYLNNLDRVNVYENTTPASAGGTLLGTVHRSYTQTPVETTANQWYEYSFNLSVEPARTARYIVFEAVSAYGTNIFMDDVLIQEIYTTPVFYISPAGWDYSGVELGEPTVKQFQITNIGVGTITINSGDIYITGDTNNAYTLSADGLPVSLTEGASYNFTVTFTPIDLGVQTATLNVQDNLGARVLHTYNLSGSGIPEVTTHILNLAATVTNVNDVVLTWQGVNGQPGEPGWLHYDSGNNSSGLGSTGEYANFDVAIKFSSDFAAEFAGMEISQIKFFPRTASTDYTLKIWTGDDASYAPTTEVYSQVVTTPLIGAWNEVALTTPYPVTGTTALWIGYNVNVTIAGSQYPAGLDAGPAVTGYGDLTSLGGWHPISPGINRNLNIQAYVDNPPARYAGAPAWLNIPVVDEVLQDGSGVRVELDPNASPDRGLQGFNIYRDADPEPINAALVTAYTYTDLDLAAGTYTYRVQALLNLSTGPMSEPVQATIAADDLAATAITGPSYGIAQQSLSFDITVFNNGANTQSNYAVKLMSNTMPPVELASLTVTEPLAPNTSATHTVYWTPTTANSYEVFGQVVLTGDENLDNDITGIKSVYVIPSDWRIVLVGNPDSTSNLASLLWYFYYKNNVAETIYFPDELHMTSGDVTAVVYKNQFTQELLQKPVKIYMTNTTLENLSGGFSPGDSLTLVFDGLVDFPLGTNEVIIPLTTPFSYTGGNLLIRVFRPFEETTYNSTNYFRYTSTTATHPTRSRYCYSNTITYDPLAPSGTTYSSNNVPNTWVVFANAVPDPEAVMQGYVYEFGTTTPIVGATVTLTDERYSTTTDNNGYYEFRFWEAHTVSASVSKANYYTESMTNVVLPLGTPVNQNFFLTPLPRVTVSGIVTSNDYPAGLEGATVKLFGYANYETTTGVDGAFSIADVFGNVDGSPYTVTVAKQGYQSYGGDTTVYEANVNLGTIDLTENLWTPYNLAAERSGGNAQLIWEPAAEPGYYFSDFEDDNGGWVGSGYGDWEWTNTYNVANFVDSYGSSSVIPPPTAYSGTGMWGTIINTNHSNSGTFSYLTQTIDLGGFDSPVLVFQSWENLFGSFDYAQVAVNGTLIWGPSWDSSGTQWRERVISLAAYADQEVVIQFQMYASTVVNYAGWYIDDVYIGSADGRVAENERWFLDYDVYRLLAADEGTPGNWVLLQSAYGDTTYLDTGFGVQPGGTYKWAVKANYSGTLQSEPIFSNTLGIVAAPQDITATKVGANVQLDWAVDPGASFYRIYASDDPYTGFAYIGYSTTNSYTITAPADMKKFYIVSAGADEDPVPAPPVIRQ